MTIGVPRETFKNERRVALSPAAVSQFTKQGFNVVIEEGAGVGARFLDEDYINAGAKMKSLKDVYNSSDIIMKVCDLLFLKKMALFTLQSKRKTINLEDHV
jgi:NAD(P) transhydrogenase